MIVTNNDKIIDVNGKIKGDKTNGKFKFETTKNESILLKVGISMVSIAGARNNLKIEINDWDFEEVRNNARKSWNDELSKIGHKKGWH